MKKVRDVMTEQVEVIDANASLREAADKMRTQNVGALPVVEGQRLAGMVTDRDIVVRGIAMGRDPNTSKVSEVMTPDIEAINADASVDEAIEKMRQKEVRRLLVVDENKRLVGIVTLGDLTQEVDPEKAARVLETAANPEEPPPRR